MCVSISYMYVCIEYDINVQIDTYLLYANMQEKNEFQKTVYSYEICHIWINKMVNWILKIEKLRNKIDFRIKIYQSSQSLRNEHIEISNGKIVN